MAASKITYFLEFLF